MADHAHDGPGYERVVDLQSRRALKGGGGDGTFDDMEARVARLEKAFEKIDAKLDRIVSDVAEMKGKLSMLPDAKAFGALEGRVNALPTGWQITLALLSTWAAGSAIVFALTRFLK